MNVTAAAVEEFDGEKTCYEAQKAQKGLTLRTHLHRGFVAGRV
jgi:hypothetical protein